MALGSTQPLTELSTRNILGGIGRLARRADNLATACGLMVYKMWEPQHLKTLGPAQSVTGIPLLYFTHPSCFSQVDFCGTLKVITLILK
jgi:hypothetical protein